MAATGEDLPDDCNHDGLVDMTDVALLETCLVGPLNDHVLSCDCFDLNADESVDMADFAVFRPVSAALKTPPRILESSRFYSRIYLATSDFTAAMQPIAQTAAGTQMLECI